MIKQNQTHRYREETRGDQWGGGRWERQDRGGVLKRDKLLCIKLNKNHKDSFYSQGNFVLQLCNNCKPLNTGAKPLNIE